MAIGSERLKQVLVIIATLGVIGFNYLAAAEYVNGVTPEVISALHPTPVTPAGYAFMIWSLIYLGLIVFSIYQALPSKLARFAPLRSVYIFSCVANCGWIYFWHYDQVTTCLIVILALLLSLLVINIKAAAAESYTEYWLVKAPFGVYFGWVTAASIVNFFVMLQAQGVEMSAATASIAAAVAILFAAFLGVVVRLRLANYFYPLAIAWAVTAIAVKQSGQTLIVVAAAIGCIVTLFAALSFVLTSKATDYNQPKP